MLVLELLVYVVNLNFATCSFSLMDTKKTKQNKTNKLELIDCSQIRKNLPIKQLHCKREFTFD